MFERCQHDHGRHNCEKWGAVVYPKCAEGYDNFGCCLCRPEQPDCDALGMNRAGDLECAKKIIWREPKLKQCPFGKEQNLLLCYEPCRAGYKGVGPVCWGETPEGWSDCGMGASNDGPTCTWVIQDQVVSVASMALNIATFGATSAGKELLPSTGSQAYLSLKADYEKLAENIKGIFKTYPQVARIVKSRETLGSGVTRKLHSVCLQTNEALTKFS